MIHTETTSANLVRDEEIQWMLNKRPLVHSKSQLVIDYGDEAKDMIEAFNKRGQEFAEKYLPTLAWHGVASRWKDFLNFLDNCSSKPENAESAFRAYAQHLGRVTSYRALALTDEQFNTIKNANSIYPSGRLRTDAKTIDALVLDKGVKFIAYARLYIGLGLLKYDPSLSLHDDPETAVCIAGGYVSNDKKIHLMGMSVPKIEVLGYLVRDIQDKKAEGRWFAHRGIWFDAENERTERYTLYEIPFYSERIQSLRIFTTNDEIEAFLAPFQKKQLQLKNQ